MLGVPDARLILGILIVIPVCNTHFKFCSVFSHLQSLKFACCLGGFYLLIALNLLGYIHSLSLSRSFGFY